MRTGVPRLASVRARGARIDHTLARGGKIAPQPLFRDPIYDGAADLVVSGDCAFLFYFTHPGRRGEDVRKDGTEQRRSSIQVVELQFKDGRLTCNRDEPTHINLVPPAKIESH